MTGVSVTVAVIYYMFTLRINMRTQQLALKSQEQTLETRQAQILMQLFQVQFNKASVLDFIKLLNMEWTDYDDFEKKYGSDNNPENYAMRNSFNNLLDAAGFLAKKGLIDVDNIYEIWSFGTISYWNKFRDVFLKQRVVYNMPDMVVNMEYLYNEMIRISKLRGGYISSKDSMRPYSYHPDVQTTA
jgi:hypothetical protein